VLAKLSSRKAVDLDVIIEARRRARSTPRPDSRHPERRQDRHRRVANNVGGDADRRYGRARDALRAAAIRRVRSAARRSLPAKPPEDYRSGQNALRLQLLPIPGLRAVPEGMQTRMGRHHPKLDGFKGRERGLGTPDFRLSGRHKDAGNPPKKGTADMWLDPVRSFCVKGASALSEVGGAKGDGDKDLRFAQRPRLRDDDLIFCGVIDKIPCSGRMVLRRWRRRRSNSRNRSRSDVALAPGEPRDTLPEHHQIWTQGADVRRRASPIPSARRRNRA